MRASLPLLLLLVAASALPARAAERNYTVTSFEKIRVDGPFDVKLSTGVSPFAKASGDWAGIDRVSLSVEGQTLVIHPPAGSSSTNSKGRAVIEVGTPRLTNAYLNGPGRLMIDKVRSLSFDLAIQGSGSATIEALDVDQFSLGVAGVASVRIAGKAKAVRALIRGNSSLDASSLEVRDLRLGAEGAAVAHVRASDTAAIEANGPVTITVDGKPACTVKSVGSGSIDGC